MAAAVLMTAACQEGLDQISTEEGMGYVTLNITPSEHTRATAFAPEELRVRIYDEDNRLVRLYTESDDIPEKIALVAGSYTFKVEARDKKHTTAFKGSDVTDDREKIYYIGEKPVTVTAGEPVEAEIECDPQHVRVGVTLSEDDGENELLSDVKIALAPMLIDGSGKATDKKKKADFDKAYKDGIDKLEFEVAKVAEEDLDDYAYFLLPEDEDGDPVETIAWVITAKHTAAAENEGGDPVVTSIDKAGQIVVDKGKAYELQFRYSQLSDGSITVTVNVDYSVEGEDHTVTFKPEPEIKPAGVNPWTEGGDANANVFVVGENKSFTIESINPITALKVNEVEIWSDSATRAEVTADMFEVTPSDGNKKFDVTVKSAYFATLAGGEQDFSLSTYDGETKVGEFDTKFLNQGLVISNTTADLWANTATFSGIVTQSGVSDVKVQFRRKGTSEWATTKVGTITGQAVTDMTSTAAWDNGSNNVKGHKVYKPNVDKSIFANNTYECQLMIGSEPYGPIVEYIKKTTQSIPDGDMQSTSLLCWSNDSSKSSFWGSGNNSMSEILCEQVAYQGTENKRAHLVARNPVSLLASGNLFTGTFTFGDPSFGLGTVRFGVPYIWDARPRALRLKYWADIGTVNVAKHKEVIKVGEPDQGSIYVCIIDWTEQHGVVSGMSKVSGVWSPEDGANPKDSEGNSIGKIIGYAVLYPQGKTSEDNSQMKTEELEIVYYDNVGTKPTEGNFSLIISAATSRYGDYMNGCNTSEMYVDDFEWVY